MRTIIFDFDGTIVDSLDAVTEIFEQLTGKLDRLSKHEIAALRHLPIRTVAQKLDVPMWQVPYLLLRGRRLMSNHISELKLFAGMADLLGKLHGEGYRLIIVSSNGTNNVRLFLKRHDLLNYFANIHANIGLFDKAQALRKVMRKNNLQADDCIYVGDESRDIEACKLIGMHCVAVAWGFADPDFLAKLHPSALANTPSELKTAIERLVTTGH